MRVTYGISQLAALIVIVIVIGSGLIGYEFGFNQRSQQATTVTTISSESAPGSTIISFQTVTTITKTTIANTTMVTRYLYVGTLTETLTHDQTNIVSQNASLSDLVQSNTTLDGFPDSIGINPKTGTVYVEYSFNTTNLAVINGSTNSIIASVPLGNATQATPIVNPDTNTVYIGNVIINGTDNTISDSVNTKMTFVGVDPISNTIYALSNNFNGSSTVYEINGSTNAIIGNLTLAGDPEAGDNPYAMNERTGVPDLAVCTEYCGHSEQYIIGISANASGLQIVSRILLNKLVFNLVCKSGNKHDLCYSPTKPVDLNKRDNESDSKRGTIDGICK